MVNELSYLSLAPHVKKLRIGGFYQLSGNSPKLHKFIHTIYRRFVFFLVVTYTIQQIIKVYQVRDDLNKVINTMSLLLTYSDCIYKATVLWKKADQIELLLNAMKGPIFNKDDEEHHRLLLQTCRQSHLLLRAFNVIAGVTALLLLIYPIVMFAQGKAIEFEIWLPFDAYRSPHFYAVMIYVWIQNSWLGFNNSTTDTFISFFLAQCKTQLSILRLDLENVVQRSKEEATCLSMPFGEVFQKHFHEILLHYNEIVNFASVLQNIFSGLLLYQFLISGWIICTTAYRTVNIDPASVEFISMMMYMSCIIVELSLFCHFGHEVNSESECITESAYGMDWLELPIRHRKDLIIFMERIKLPLKPMAGVFIPLSNKTFVSIMRSSYTFYAFLKNTN